MRNNDRLLLGSDNGSWALYFMGDSVGAGIFRGQTYRNICVWRFSLRVPRRRR